MYVGMHQQSFVPSDRRPGVTRSDEEVYVAQVGISSIPRRHSGVQARVRSPTNLVHACQARRHLQISALDTLILDLYRVPQLHRLFVGLIASLE